MKRRIFVSVFMATAFIATSISVGAATMNITSAKNLLSEGVRIESRDMLQDCSVDSEMDLIRDRDKLQNYMTDSEKDQVKDRDRLQDCIKDQG